MAEKKKIGIAVLGNGSRSYLTKVLLDNEGKGNVEVLALFDPDKNLSEKCRKDWNMPNARICDSYEEAINTPGVDWVMIFSPNVYHREHILAAFAAGKHVFSEKPLATSIEDCQQIFNAHQASSSKFATGFVFRYAPMYRRAKEILSSGILGKIISIDANENVTPAHGGYIMCNWRRFVEFAGPHILEKCCHDLDLLNWYCESVPTRVASFGGRNFFVPENEYLMEKYGKDTFHSWADPNGEPSPFTSQKDLMDNQVAIMQYRNNIRVQFQATMSNAKPERRMFFSCTEGNLEVELYTSMLKYQQLGSDEVHSIAFGADGHGDGDHVIMKELYETMANDDVLPKCSGNEGLESAVVAMAIDRAATTNTVVEMEEIWKSLNR